MISEQSVYNLLTRDIEREVLPAAREYGLGVIPWSPLAGGLLGGILQKEKEGRSGGSLAQDRLSAKRSQVEAYEKFCADIGESPANVGLAWLLAQPGVTGPIIGPRTLDQLEGSLRALEIQFDDAQLTRLDEISGFDKPGVAAPESYAW